MCPATLNQACIAGHVPATPAQRDCRLRSQHPQAAQSSQAGPAGAFDDATKAKARETLFNNIAPVYDELNNRLSFGRHWGWKRDAVRRSGAAPGHRALDLCCGSGDLTVLLARAVGQRGSVVGLDFAQDMLDYAAQRRASGDLASANSREPEGQIEWTRGDATALDFANDSFDAVTMGFGLRNVADTPAALQEIRRVLKPGGCAAILDFNHSPNAVIDGVQVCIRIVVVHDLQLQSVTRPQESLCKRATQPREITCAQATKSLTMRARRCAHLCNVAVTALAVQNFFLQNLVVPAARRRGLEDEYAYLRPSIQAFPQGPEQEQLAYQVGFAHAEHLDVELGLMGCLVVQKGPLESPRSHSGW